MLPPGRMSQPDSERPRLSRVWANSESQAANLNTSESDSDRDGGVRVSGPGRSVSRYSLLGTATVTRYGSSSSVPEPRRAPARRPARGPPPPPGGGAAAALAGPPAGSGPTRSPSPLPARGRGVTAAPGHGQPGLRLAYVILSFNQAESESAGRARRRATSGRLPHGIYHPKSGIYHLRYIPWYIQKREMVCIMVYTIDIYHGIYHYYHGIYHYYHGIYHRYIPWYI
jgi:hypothetical protein